MKKEMNAATYHAEDGMGSSALKYALKSMAHYKAYVDGEIIIEGKNLDIGTAAHSAILEKSTEIFTSDKDIYIELSEKYKGVRQTKAYKEWKEARNAEGKIVLGFEEVDAIKKMFGNFFAHSKAPMLVEDGTPECSFFAEHETGLKLKARTDYYVQSDEGDYIVDYKTSSSEIDGEGFSRSCAKFRYDLQAAHYMDVVERATGRPVKDYFWIVQETSSPYGLRIYRATEDMLERARDIRNKLLQDIAAAKESNIYKCYDEGIFGIDLPHWAVKEDYNE